MAQKHGKKYQEVAKLVDPAKMYTPAEAIDLAKRATYTAFDPTVELHLRMGVDPRYQDQVVRGVALLPNGLGKQVRVLVFAQGDTERIAREAGADFIGNDDLIKQIEGGWFDFDVAIATPDMMGRVGRLGRYLGRRNLMPNPKSGTIVPPGDLPRAIRDARLGRVEFKLDKTSLIHVPIGKASFENQALFENLQGIVDAIVKAKPSGAKGQYIRGITLTTTMGPGIPLALPETLALSR